MRKTAYQCVHELARADRRVVFIGSDITTKPFEAFRDECPGQFFMEGIYEAHLIGMAAGLAMSGKVPYLNTIASFLTRRCYEQILIDVCMHDLPVRLLGSGGGTVYAPLGGTHIANEDIAILRVIPNMTIVAPCDADEMRRLIPKTLDWPHPIYIRFAKGNDPIVSTDRQPFEIGKAIPLRKGTDVLFVSTGIMSHRALEASGILATRGVEASVLHMHSLKPFDSEQLLDMASDAGAVVSIEEHRVNGGLGSAVAEVLMESGVGSAKRFRRLGIPDVFTEELGSQNEILEKYGLSVEGIVSATEMLLQKR